MNLEGLKELDIWLKQFPLHHKGKAKLLIESLTAISADQFEFEIQKMLLDIADKTEGKIAVFPVKRKPNEKFRDIDKEYRFKYTSADKIGYILTNFERGNSKRFINSPTVGSMKAERVNHIVLIDDLVASGGSIEKFWQNHIHKSVKSWLSYKKCQLWVVSYAICNAGVSILKKLPILDENIVSKLRLPNQHKALEALISPLIEDKQILPQWGYGDVFSGIIFQHGCPNNNPGILWQNSKGFNPLFPNRSVPPSFLGKFSNKKEPTISAEQLWKSGQYKLALGILDLVGNYPKTQEAVELITILGLISKGCKRKNLTSLVSYDIAKIKFNLNIMEENILINGESITLYGKELLEYVRLKKSKQSRAFNYDEKNKYYPSSFLGIQRNSSECL